MHKHKVITFREILFILAISLAFISGGCLPESEQDIESTTYNTVIINPAVRHQVIEGYGQGNMEQSTPVWYRKYSDQIEDIVDTLYTFKDGGLGMNICRYLMPAADAPGHDHMRRLPKYANKPFEYEDGKFNWDGHEDVLWLGQGAAKRGAKMWASWYGFPYWLSTSGCAAGSEDGKSNNLIAGKEARFIKHVVDVIKYFHTNWAIQFDYVNPINEPEADWWEAGGGQPGSKVTYQQSLELYKEIIKQFATADLNTEIIAYDAAFTNTTEYLDKFMRSEIKDDIDVLACHQYITSNDAMRRWAQTSKQTGKSLWMTEWGDWTNTKKDINNEVKQMLNYANRLHEAFEVLEANAWVMWEPSFIFNAEDDGLQKKKILLGDRTLQQACRGRISKSIDTIRHQRLQNHRVDQ